MSNTAVFCMNVEEIETQTDGRPKVTKQFTCYGCGVRLQTEDEGAIGFISDTKLQNKLKHKQYDQLLCSRCIRLTQGEMVPGVHDFRKETSNVYRNLISPEDLREQLKNVRDKKVLVVLLVDVLDLPGSLLNAIRPLIGQNPIFLIGTKIDLLPKRTDLDSVRDWLRDLAVARKLNVAEVRLVSNRKKTGFSKATASILRNRRGRDVYVMGLANVGKSAFVRAFMNEIRTLGSSNFTADAMSKGRFLPVESSMPGTTLGIIKLQALQQKGAIYDTPGIHVFHRVTHLLSPEEIRLLLPTRPLSPYVPPSPYEISKQLHQKAALEQLDENASQNEVVNIIMGDPETNSASYFWGGLVRLDIFEAPIALGLVFYSPSILKVYAFPNLKSEGDEDFEIHQSVLNGEMSEHIVTTRYLQNLKGFEQETVSNDPENLLDDLQYDPYEDLSNLYFDEEEETTPVQNEDVEVEDHRTFNDQKTMRNNENPVFFGKASVERKSGWVIAKEFKIDCYGFEATLVDFSISGIPGWISVTLPTMSKSRDRGIFRGRIWAPKGVEVFLRPSVPVLNPLLQNR